MNTTDTKFFTNENEHSLLKRFQDTLELTQYFDVLVGYFRTSGFEKLYKSLESVEKIRILVGLNIDKKTYNIIEQTSFDFDTHKNIKEDFALSVQQELDNSDDTKEVEISIAKFIEFIKQGKIEIKGHPSRNIHAKVYISRFNAQGRKISKGSVITGSSNFSENGLIAQREFNVELKDNADVKFAFDRFENLWEEGVDITKDYVDTIQTKTWLSDNITPYEIYLKFLYEYFKEEINAEDEEPNYLPKGFNKYKYQTMAVATAKKTLEAYNGVFLADVVGLGKTYISALLLQKLGGKKLIICPPVLADYWRDTMRDFYVTGFDVQSLGKLERIKADKYDYILIDEAHRFRNEMTQSYEQLHKICKGKKVILVSATPLNNKLQDILNQLKLFQPARASNIPDIRNLEMFFKNLQKNIDEYEKGTVEHLLEIEKASAVIRDKILKFVMVRRTRTEIQNHFSDDLKVQGLSFPEIQDPQRIIYSFNNNIENIFNKTITLLRDFKYSRYKPVTYLKVRLSKFEEQSQENLGGFMKGILVKRLESSFYAFKKSIGRFILSYEKFINMYEQGTVYISKKADVYDLLEQDNEEKLYQLVEEEKAEKYNSDDFRKSFIEELKEDLATLQEIQKLWKGIDDDPKLDEFIKELQTNNKLKNQKAIIFTESKETADYLYEHLANKFNTFRYCSGGGYWNGDNYGVENAKQIIISDFDQSYDKEDQQNKIQLLITTDVLAEGINLHRSNIVINYDLPWNPTRVLQRVGRVNRVGTKHNEIFVFNFFPTSQSEKHLGLEKNIKAKLQAFHNTLGEDAKYLSTDEEISSHKLFGDTLYDKLNNKNMLEDNEEESDLQYLDIIRDIAKKDKKLFEKIKKLPKKARVAKKGEETGLITFFRRGLVKKFVKSGFGELQTFLETVKYFECEKNEKGINIPDDYYEFIKENKDYLNQSNQEAEQETYKISRNEKSVVEFIKYQIKNSESFTDDEELYLRNILKAVERGEIAQKTIKKIKPELEKAVLNHIKVLSILKKNISISSVETDNIITNEPREVILSLYIQGENK